MPELSIVRVNQLGRTRTVQSSLEHVWTNPEERFVVAIGLDETANNDLTLEVWDEDISGKGDFLGQVLVAGSDREGGG